VDIKFKVKIIILSERAIRILCKLLLAISLRVIKYDTKIRLLIIATFSFLIAISHRGRRNDCFFEFLQFTFSNFYSNFYFLFLFGIFCFNSSFISSFNSSLIFSFYLYSFLSNRSLILDFFNFFFIYIFCMICFELFFT